MALQEVLVFSNLIVDFRDRNISLLAMLQGLLEIPLTAVSGIVLLRTVRFILC